MQITIRINRTVVSFYGGDEIATTSGFADLALYVKYAILENPLALSLQAGVRIPLGYSREPINNGPRLGSTDMSYEGHIHWVWCYMIEFPSSSIENK